MNIFTFWCDQPFISLIIIKQIEHQVARRTEHHKTQTVRFSAACDDLLYGVLVPVPDKGPGMFGVATARVGDNLRCHLTAQDSSPRLNWPDCPVMVTSCPSSEVSRRLLVI